MELLSAVTEATKANYPTRTTSLRRPCRASLVATKNKRSNPNQRRTTMARWRLITGHYLNVLIDGSPAEWEYKETDRNTGKQARRIFPVPVLLDPNDPADHNHPGEIIVCHEGAGDRRDIIFL